MIIYVLWEIYTVLQAEKIIFGFLCYHLMYIDAGYHCIWSINPNIHSYDGKVILFAYDISYQCITTKIWCSCVDIMVYNSFADDIDYVSCIRMVVLINLELILRILNTVRYPCTHKNIVRFSQKQKLYEAITTQPETLEILNLHKYIW